MGHDIPADVKALIAQTVSALRDLAPPSAEFEDETKNAVFEAVDAVEGAMWDLNRIIHGMLGGSEDVVEEDEREEVRGGEER